LMKLMNRSLVLLVRHNHSQNPFWSRRDCYPPNKGKGG
jgi:hypothetical protein